MLNIKQIATTLAAAALSMVLMLPALAETRIAAGETFRVQEDGYGAQFEKILENLRKHSTNQNLPPDEVLFKIAIDAMMKAIGDKHGSYFTPEQYQRLQQDMRPTDYSGVGVKLSKGSGGLVILEIFSNSGLTLMGVHVGDTITRARSSGGTDVTWDGNNIKELVAAIKGPAGTDVSLTLKRGGTALGEITVQRINTRQEFVFMKLTDDILTIRITQFSATIYQEIQDRLDENGWLKDGKLNTDIVKGVTFDVRSNPGGSLRAAVQTGDVFMEPDKNVVRVITPPNEESNGRPVAYDHPTEKEAIIPCETIVVCAMLVNGFSASASEIVSGAAQKHKVMKIVGTKTYGKGSVQTVIPLPGGSGMKATSAIYLAGGDVEIDGIGVKPDIMVQQPPAPGVSVDNKRLNGNIIRKSMDPTMDYQLGVAHKYLRAFFNPDSPLAYDSPEAQRRAMNEAHGAPKPQWTKALCDEKGLRGCPVRQTGFMGGNLSGER